ncbi:ion transporter [Methanofollis fontis]|uniref:Ion transporter n=1 Tax=Methanofollis fontis TaxID=2052832 RepID=A0A483CUI5_9EURY|nr:ion transporter [Methanofollis fontis]TAJ44978.1 ion transporter [Methanofollis fontis]
MKPEEPTHKSVKHRIHDILESPFWKNRTTAAVQITLALVILANSVAVVIFTIPGIQPTTQSVLNAAITFCLLVFAAEYILRLWACTSAPTFRERTAERLRFASGIYQIIDLISILPLCFPIFFPQDFALLRIFRLLSIFKLGRYSRRSASLAQLKRVLLRKREIFSLMIFFLVFVILFSSTVMYGVEHDAQPEKFSSIPAAMWWAMMTVTTVGYGDIYPVTPIGQTIASFVTILGVMLLALPSAILASGFIEEHQRKRDDGGSERLDAAVTLLERMGALKEKGHLTSGEFAEYKGLIQRLCQEDEGGGGEETAAETTAGK